jgi:hypothetical protein
MTLKPLLITTLASSLFVITLPRLVLAQTEGIISAAHAQGTTGNTPVIPINLDYGASLSFLETDEAIVKAWLGQANSVEVGFDNSLGQAKVMFLKQGPDTKNLDGTSLTIITQDPQGQSQVYSFLLAFKPGQLAQSIWTIRAVTASAGSTEPQTEVNSSPSAQPAIQPDSSPQLRQQKKQNKSKKANPKVATTIKTSSPIDSQPPKQTSDQKDTSQPTESGQSVPSPEPTAEPAQSIEKPEPIALVEPSTLKTEASSDQKNTNRTPAVEPKNSNAVQQLPSPKQESKLSPQPIDKGEETKASIDVVKSDKPTSKQDISTSSPQPSKTEALLTKHAQANALIRGLLEANRRGQIGEASTMRLRVNSVVRSLRRGQELQAAAKSANVPWNLTIQLLQWGKYDTSLLSETDPIYSQSNDQS